MRFAVSILFSLSALHAEESIAERAATILENNCLVCHGGAMQRARLDLRSRESAINGGERGPAIVPGNAAKSRLYRFAAALEQPSMPPGGKLSADDAQTLKAWIDAGAPYKSAASATEDKDAVLAKLEERPIRPDERRFWSFQPVKRPQASASIDAFIRAKLSAKGLVPARPAAPRELIRRAYLDLIGLPPTPEEVAAFVKDDSPKKFANLVDRLLASPHYGERWGRHWLDLARYADSGGYEFDRDRGNAYLYRDWVVKALNADMPYNEFVGLQLAGDQLRPGDRDAIIATTYLALGGEPNTNTPQTRADVLDDIIATTAGTMFGMTVGCARCHNHKFDPIPQKDYYRMQAVFFSAKPAEVPLVSTEEVAKHQERLKQWTAGRKPIRDELAAFEKPFRDRLTAEKIAKLADYIKVALATPPEKRTEGQRLNAIQVEKTISLRDEELAPAILGDDLVTWTALKKRLTGIENERPKLDTAMAVEEKKLEPSYFSHHGSVDNPGSLMKPGVLSVGYEGEWNFADGTSRRAAFADWITSRQNPLTARVMVNRIWQHHFGEGIVRTTSNFGRTGEAPTHPELLDFVASEFIQSGWSIKAMHRLIMNSAAYQMGSNDHAAGVKADPENRLLWRQARPRLEGEILRDSILAVAGTLDKTIGGPGIHPHIDPALWAGGSGRTWPGKPVDDPSTWRRSIYIFQKRTIPVPMMELFDGPSATGACARRNRSTIATQALILMNNAFVLDQARRFAGRLARDAQTPEAQVRRAFDLALARQPSATELRESVAFIQRSAQGLTDFAQAIFNLNEFAYIP